MKRLGFMLLALLALPLAGQAAEAPNASPIGPLPPEQMFQLGALESLPYPVLMPYPLPQHFALTDVRVHHLPHARAGVQRSYGLVFAAGTQSFMIQSRLSGYTLTPSPCPGQRLKQSEPVFLPGFSFEPQRLELLSPACSITGQVLSPDPISPEQAEQIWRTLHWYLPLPYRLNQPRPLPLF